MDENLRFSKPSKSLRKLSNLRKGRSSSITSISNKEGVSSFRNHTMQKSINRQIDRTAWTELLSNEKPDTPSLRRARNKVIRLKAARQPSSLTALFVRILAKRAQVYFSPTYADRWASAVTRLAGDNPKSDSTDDLLVALTRAGKLSPQEMAKMVIAHHRSSRGI